MTTKVQKLKIALYKKQILEAFATYTILDILYGEELHLYNEFDQQTSLLDSTNRKKFSYYNPEIHEYLDCNLIYLEAQVYFAANLPIFCDKEVVICFIQFKEEYFGLKMEFDDNLIAIYQKLNTKDFLIINETLSKLLALAILEYDIEVLVFKEDKS